jgi:DNA repair protein RadA
MTTDSTRKKLLQELETQVVEDVENVKKQEDLKQELLEQKKTEKEEQSKIELKEIDDIPQVSAIMKKKLAENGIRAMPDLANASAVDLHEKLASQKASVDFCEYMIEYAHNYLREIGFWKNAVVASRVLLNDNTIRKRFSTGDEALDLWFGGGGIESKAVTELYGKFKSGKSQMCFSTALNTAASGHNVLYIDTENTYSPKRIDEIAEYNDLDRDMVQDNIKVMKPSSAAILSLYIDKIVETIREHNIELVVIDSIIALHRAEYIGRSNLANRQQQLSKMLMILVKAAENEDVGVLITNQVLESPDMFKHGEFATGGNVMSHASTHRVHMATKNLKPGKTHSKMTMEDSPRYARTEIVIELGPWGVKSVDASKLVKNKDDEDELIG